ncbi:hypothetical protein [Paenibacillus phyllosphaerae]
MNDDGVIDIIDLTVIAKRILDTEV